MRKESQIISRENGFSVWELGRDRAREMTDFVYDTYFSRFKEKYGYLGHDDYVKMAIGDLFSLNSSTIYSAISDTTGEFLGSIRIIERCASLPAEKEFEFDVLEEFGSHFCSGEQGAAPRMPRVNRIFEIGRFATNLRNLTNSQLRKSDSLFVTDCLLRSMIHFCSQESNNLTIASLDVTTHRILRMRGIHFRPLKEAKDYLGSPTLPVILPVDLCLSEMRRQTPERYAFFTETMRPAAELSA